MVGLPTSSSQEYTARRVAAQPGVDALVQSAGFAQLPTGTAASGRPTRSQLARRIAVACGQTSHARRYQGSYCQKAICRAAVRPTIAVIRCVRSNSMPGRLLRLRLCRVLLDQLNGEELECIGDRNEEIDAYAHPRDG